MTPATTYIGLNGSVTYPLFALHIYRTRYCGRDDGECSAQRYDLYAYCHGIRDQGVAICGRLPVVSTLPGTLARSSPSVRMVSTIDQSQIQNHAIINPRGMAAAPKLIPEILALKDLAAQKPWIASIDRMLKASNGWLPLISPSIPIVKKHLLRFHTACTNTLERLHLESRKTLNLLSLVIAHPFNVERRTALKLQRDREKEAQLADQRCKRNLFGWLDRF
jgi:hypothetical protein